MEFLLYCLLSFSGTSLKLVKHSDYVTSLTDASSAFCTIRNLPRSRCFSIAHLSSYSLLGCCRVFPNFSARLKIGLETTNSSGLLANWNYETAHSLVNQIGHEENSWMQSYEMEVKEVHCQLSYQRSFLNYRMWLLTYLNLDWQQSLLATSSNLIQK